MTRLSATPPRTHPDADGGRIPSPRFIAIRRRLHTERGIFAVELHHPAFLASDRAALDRLRRKLDRWDRGGAERRKVETENAAALVFKEDGQDG